MSIWRAKGFLVRCLIGHLILKVEPPPVDVPTGAQKQIGLAALSKIQIPPPPKIYKLAIAIIAGRYLSPASANAAAIRNIALRIAGNRLSKHLKASPAKASLAKASRQ
jgi:hypothetical protein